MARWCFSCPRCSSTTFCVRGSVCVAFACVYVGVAFLWAHEDATRNQPTPDSKRKGDVKQTNPPPPLPPIKQKHKNEKRKHDEYRLRKTSSKCCIKPFSPQRPPCVDRFHRCCGSTRPLLFLDLEHFGKQRGRPTINNCFGRCKNPLINTGSGG